MTEPSQYFKGRTVQEQMNEVIGYVDTRSTEVATDVAAAKASEVLVPAEAAKVAAQAAQSAAETAQGAAKDAQDAAEAARDTTLAALPQVQSDINALEGRMNTVELKVQTAEGNIVTIQGQIVALQTADGQNVKINNINQYAVGLTGNSTKTGSLTLSTDSNDARFIAIETRDMGNETGWIAFCHGSSVSAWFNVYRNADSSTGILMKVKNANGTVKQSVLIEGDR